MSLLPDHDLSDSLSFNAFVTDPDSLEQVQAAAQMQGFDGGVVAMAGLDDAANMLENEKTPDILLVDIDDVEDPVAGLGQVADVCDPGTSVVVIGSVNDLRLYQTLKDEGVDEYLLKPVTAAALSQAFEKIRQVPEEAAPAQTEPQQAGGSEIIAVIGSRGGVGATSVAASLAWTLANKQGRKTALVDLDPLFGGVCLTLDLEPGPGLAEALADHERIDTLFLERAMMRHGDNLAVLAGENVLHDAPVMDYHAVAHLLDELRRNFDCIIIDFPRSALVQLPQAGSLFDKVLLVTDLSLHSLRDCMRLSGHFSDDVGADAVMFVGNDPRPDTKAETAQKDFEKAAGKELAALFPHDAKAALEAGQHGKAIAEVAKGATAHAIGDFVALLTGKAEKKTAWQKLKTLSFGL